MNIERIKNYNQKMLALFSTIMVVLAAIGLISLLVFLISEFIPSKPPAISNALLSDERVEQLNRDSLRQQIISYEEPRLIDTAKLVYIIPVSIRTLELPEYYADEENVDVLDLFGSGSFKKTRVKQFYGLFINLIVYDYPSNKTWKICENRIMGNDLSIAYFDDEVISVFTAAEKDTDKDGKITLSDFNNLYVYSLKEQRLRKISKAGLTVLSYKFVEGKKDLLITFGDDRNKDGVYMVSQEPAYVLSYNYESELLVDVVDTSVQKELQRVVDKK